MTSEFEQQLSASIERRLESSKTEIHRLKEVGKWYNAIDKSFQLDLADDAIIWTIAALARHSQRDDCESMFFASIDGIYTLTPDAAADLTASQRQQICVSSNAIRDHLDASVNRILRESAQKLAALDENKLERRLAEVLHNVRTTYLQHVFAPKLCDLMVRCINLCFEIESVENGVQQEPFLVPLILDVTERAYLITHSVHEDIKAGKLVVRDGKIVNTSDAMQ